MSEAERAYWKEVVEAGGTRVDELEVAEYMPVRTVCPRCFTEMSELGGCWCYQD